MAKKMVFTLTGDLPDDDMDAAELIGKLKPARDAFLAAVKDTGMKHVHETKTQAIKPSGPRKPRSPATPPA